MRRPWVQADRLYGANLVNDKAKVGAEVFAERAIKRTGVKLQGGRRRHGVNFEMGEPSVGEHQGID